MYLFHFHVIIVIVFELLQEESLLFDIEEELKNIMNRLPSEDLKGISVDIGV